MKLFRSSFLMLGLLVGLTSATSFANDLTNFPHHAGLAAQVPLVGKAAQKGNLGYGGYGGLAGYGGYAGKAAQAYKGATAGYLGLGKAIQTSPIIPVPLAKQRY